MYELSLYAVLSEPMLVIRVERMIGRIEKYYRQLGLLGSDGSHKMT